MAYFTLQLIGHHEGEDFLQANRERHFLNWGSFLQGEPSMYSADKKLGNALPAHCVCLSACVCLYHCSVNMLPFLYPFSNW